MSLTHNLMLMRGVWHDHVELHDLAGRPLEHDPWGGTPGPAPYDNLIYIDFDGERYLQTNVTFRGRPLHVRSFTGAVRDGILHFDPLGPNDPGHIGVSGGPGVIVYAPNAVTDAWQRYSEPDVIHVDEARRTRVTILYRNGAAVRTLTARGVKLSPVADRRVSFDPRGADGPVHEPRDITRVFQARG